MIRSMTPQDWMVVVGALASAVLLVIGQLRDWLSKREQSQTDRMTSIVKEMIRKGPQ